MTIKQEYDFSDYKSFPSSVKAESDTGISQSGMPGLLTYQYIPIRGQSTVRIEGMIKTANATKSAWLAISGIDTLNKGVDATWFHAPTIASTWTKVQIQGNMPSNVTKLLIEFAIAGSGTAGVVAKTWFDDVKIYQDDVLIYTNNFSNWNPYIGAGVGALAGIPAYIIAKKSTPKKRAMIAVGATIAGAVIGGAAGYLTAKP